MSHFYTSPLQLALIRADWSTLKWGLRVERTVASGLPRDTSTNGFFQVDAWYPYRRTRPDLQTLGSCAWNAVANTREVWDCVAGVLPKQRNHNEAYRRYSIGVHGEFKDQGTRPQDIVPWINQLRLFDPETTKYEEIELTAEAICKALLRGPLLVGQALHHGWSPDHLSKYGEVDDSKINTIDPNAGHMMMADATNYRGPDAKMIGKGQSWGPLGYEGNGEVWERMERFLYAALCKPILIIPDLEAIRSAPVPEWW